MNCINIRGQMNTHAEMKKGNKIVKMGKEKKAKEIKQITTQNKKNQNKTKQ